MEWLPAELQFEIARRAQLPALASLMASCKRLQSSLLAVLSQQSCLQVLDDESTFGVAELIARLLTHRALLLERQAEGSAGDGADDRDGDDDGGTEYEVKTIHAILRPYPQVPEPPGSYSVHCGPHVPMSVRRARQEMVKCGCIWEG